MACRRPHLCYSALPHPQNTTEFGAALFGLWMKRICLWMSLTGLWKRQTYGWNRLIYLCNLKICI